MNFGKLNLSVFISIFIVMFYLSSFSYGMQTGPHADRIMKTNNGNFAGGKFGKTFQKTVNGQKETCGYFFIEGNPSSLKAIKAHGVEINTVTSSGIMTAIVPLKNLNAISKIAGVKKIEAGTAVSKYMNEATGPDGVNLPDVSYPRAAQTGAGVLVGVIDTGIDIKHPDFLDGSNNTRIVSIWDHTLDPSDVGNMASSPSGFTYGTEWTRQQIQGGYDTCLHRDVDGHGSHVAGTAAGNGSAASTAGPYTGVAPEAELVIVKFDFDNVKDRNSDTNILDAVNWIFQKAEQEGKPCVINMSLGSAYGPHDGSTAEERGINDLVGPGKIVCVSAGNAGSAYGGTAFETFGAPIHGSGSAGTEKDIVLETESSPVLTPGSNNDYIFFDIWYNGDARVQITTPSGRVYPPNFKGTYRTLWKTDGKSGGFDTTEGLVYCSNVSGSDAWDTDNTDKNIYIEISDYYGTEPAPGKWTVEIIPLNGDFSYQSWHGTSDSFNKTYFWYDSGTTQHTYGDTGSPYLSDSIMTIGKPATAAEVISVGAYQTKNTWPAREYLDWTNPDSDYNLVMQSYGVEPITYYDPFVMHDLAFFSSRGPSRDGRTQPFISAPGVGIVAPLSQTVLNDPAENYYRRLNRVEFEGYYATLQGTSMSGPGVTGSVALLLEKASAMAINATPDNIKAYLSDGARGDGFTGATPNNNWGWGKADVTGSLAAIQVPALAIDTGSLPDGTVGISYSTVLSASGGATPYEWQIISGSLPAGLALNASTGEISGVPTVEETAQFTVQVTDSAGSTDTALFAILITGAGSSNPEVLSCTPDTGSLGQRLTVTITGNTFQEGATVEFGSGIAVQNTVFISSSELSCTIRISKKASTGNRDITVTNPDGTSGILADGFTVTG